MVWRILKRKEKAVSMIDNKQLGNNLKKAVVDRVSDITAKELYDIADKTFDELLHKSIL